VRTFPPRGDQSFRDSIQAIVARLRRSYARGRSTGTATFSTVTQHHFNPVARRCAGARHLAEVDELVEPGELQPDDIHTRGVCARVVVVTGERPPTAVEKRPVRRELVPLRNRSPRRSRAVRCYTSIAASGLPTLVPDPLGPTTGDFSCTARHGVLGVGPYPAEDMCPYLINAGKEPLLVRMGCCELLRLPPLRHDPCGARLTLRSSAEAGVALRIAPSG